jgi:ABC-type uncharacterized transport system involved in gliding motility auxiliary subunit
MEVMIMSKAGRILYLLSILSLASFGISRFLIGEFIPALWAPIALFFIFLIAAIAADRKVYAEFFAMKTTKHGMNMGALTLLALLLIVTLNFFGVKYSKTWDLSLARVNSLSEQSIKLVKNLDDELRVRFFYKKGQEGIEENRRSFRELVKKYQDYSTQVKLEFVEVNERPDLAEEYGVNKGTGIVFLDYKGRRNRIEKIEEQELTSALVKVTREKDKTAYFLAGHGERSIDDSSEASGLASLKTLLEGNRYVVKSLSLTSNAQIPADADLLFVIGPDQAALEYEVKAIEDYLRRGGSVVLALDPGKSHGLNKVLEQVGVELKNNFLVVVMDTVLGKAINPSATPATEFSTSHAITKVFGKSQFLVSRLPQAIAKATVPAGIEVEEIVKTSDKSYAFATTKFDGGGSPGPFAIAMSVKGKYAGAESSAKEFSMIVTGTSSVFGNQLLYQNLNRDFVLNTAAYLAKEENLISITPKEVGITEMNITPMQFYIFIFGFILPLPIVLLSTSGVLWYRRRNA